MECVPPELCVSWRKLVQMSAFFFSSFFFFSFLTRVAGCLAGCIITWSLDLLKADFPGPNPRGVGYTLSGNY